MVKKNKFLFVFFYTLNLVSIEAQVFDTFNISLVLPFCANKTQSQLHKQKLVAVQDAAVSYYRGVLLAMKNIESKGVYTSLTIYDTEKDSINTCRIFALPSLKKSHFVIGPLFKEGIEIANSNSIIDSIYHVSPVLSFESRLKSSFLIRPVTDISNYPSLLVPYLSENDTGRKYFIIDDGMKSSRRFISEFSHMADSFHLDYTVRYTKEAEWFQDIADPGTPVTLIFPTNNDVLAQKLFKNLDDTGAGIRIIGTDTWLQFKNVNYARWAACHVHILTSNWADYSKENVKEFRKKFLESFFTDPDEYAMMAYDQIFALYNLKKNKTSDIYTGLVNQYLFKQDPKSNNWINTRFQFLIYQDYILKRIW